MLLTPKHRCGCLCLANSNILPCSDRDIDSTTFMMWRWHVYTIVQYVLKSDHNISSYSFDIFTSDLVATWTLDHQILIGSSIVRTTYRQMFGREIQSTGFQDIVLTGCMVIIMHGQSKNIMTTYGRRTFGRADPSAWNALQNYPNSIQTF